MAVFDFLKRTNSRGFYDLSLDEILTALATKSTSSDEIYTPDFAPEGGWDKWCAWAAKQGKIARVVRSLSKNAMAFDFTCKDEKAAELARTLARNVYLNTKLILAFKDWLSLGRTFLEPVQEISGKNRELIKVKVVAPETIKVFRDNETDISDLKNFLKSTDYASYATELETGSGDNVIGFVQYWEKRHETNKSIFFKPDELIFIPRYPTNSEKDGISLLRENYTTIMNKLGLEKSQAIMGKRFTDPILKFILPEKWWGKLEEVKKKVNKGIKAGLNIWLPEGAGMDTVEPKGNPTAVIRAQQHTEDQFIAGMGFADSFTESTSSNRSVGEIQLQFLERDIDPERKMFAEVLEDRLLHPYIKEKLGNVDMPVFVFEDLTPRDEITWAQTMKDYLPYMTDTQKRQLFDDLGYPVPDDEELPQRPEPMFPAQMSADMATQKGVPKPIVKKSKEAREEFKEEIERLRDELAEVFS